MRYVPQWLIALVVLRKGLGEFAEQLLYVGQNAANAKEIATIHFCLKVSV